MEEEINSVDDDDDEGDDEGDGVDDNGVEDDLTFFNVNVLT